MKYTQKCCRCGLCCLSEQCVISIFMHGKIKECPELSFKGDIATCALAGLVPIGDGCCIKARAFRNGNQYDFASLPPELKINAVQSIRRNNYDKIY